MNKRPPSSRSEVGCERAAAASVLPGDSSADLSGLRFDGPVIECAGPLPPDAGDRFDEVLGSGDWLPPLHDDGPRFPVAAHLRSDLLEMCAQFLLAGAVRDLHDPAGESRCAPEAVDAHDLIAETAQPASDYDNDRMRGFDLVEQFMELHDLQWNRRKDDTHTDAAERCSRDQLRALRLAGLRVLATLTHDLTDQLAPPGSGSPD